MLETNSKYQYQEHIHALVPKSRDFFLCVIEIALSVLPTYHPAKTSSTLSLVNGKCLRGFPVKVKNALAIAPPIKGRLTSPRLVGGSEEGMSAISILSGASAILRIG